MRVAIYGAGAMGTILGAFITKSGKPIDLISRNKEHIDLLQRCGAHVVGSVDFTQPVSAYLPEQMSGKYDILFLMTKQSENAAVLSFLKNFLSETGIICTLQNGLPEPLVARFVGADRTYGCAVAWGATMKEAGTSILTSEREAMTFSLGAFGKDKSYLGVLSEYLSAMGKVSVCDNLLGARWSKLAVNAAFSGVSAMTGMTFGEVAKDKTAKEIALGVFRECAAVAERAGIRPAEIQGHDVLKWLGASTLLGRIRGRIFLPFAIRRHARLQSGMYFSLKKGCRCDIDYINGVISAYGAKYNVATPFCDKICRVVHAVENGEATLGIHNLQAFADLIS